MVCVVLRFGGICFRIRSFRWSQVWLCVRSTARFQCVIFGFLGNGDVSLMCFHAYMFSVLSQMFSCFRLVVALFQD